MGDRRFGPRHRMRKRREYEQVKHGGRKMSLGCFFAQALTGEDAPEAERRLGVIATKKLGNAVVRNRAKRVFRELFRLEREGLPQRCDLVVIPNISYAGLSFTDLRKRFRKLCERLAEAQPVKTD